MAGSIIATILTERYLRNIAQEQPTLVKIAPGRYELERIPDPFNSGQVMLVLRGTMTGMTERAWRRWLPDPRQATCGHPPGILSITIVENGKPLTLVESGPQPSLFSDETEHPESPP